jgi:DNA-binding Xre family transcriptional regulator
MPRSRKNFRDRLQNQSGTVWLNLTYAQFARKVGLSDSTLYRMEMGEQNVTLKTLEQICDRLKCRVSDLFDEGK